MRNVAGVRVEANSFLDNIAHFDGGAIYALYSNDFALVNNTMESNEGGYNGGAIYHDVCDRLVVQHNVFKRNNANFGNLLVTS